MFASAVCDLDLSMRYFLCLILLTAGCDSGIPYPPPETSREDKAARYIHLNLKGYKMTDAELGEYTALGAEFSHD